jgi:hypothetical protein
MESTDKPAGPLVSGVLLVGWVEWADSTTFSTTRLREAYDTAEVDAFREAIRDTFIGIGDLLGRPTLAAESMRIAIKLSADLELSRTTGQPLDKEPFTLVSRSGQPLDTANGRPLDTPAPL